MLPPNHNPPLTPCLCTLVGPGSAASLVDYNVMLDLFICIKSWIYRAIDKKQDEHQQINR